MEQADPALQRHPIADAVEVVLAVFWIPGVKFPALSLFLVMPARAWRWLDRVGLLDAGSLSLYFHYYSTFEGLGRKGGELRMVTVTGHGRAVLIT